MAKKLSFPVTFLSKPADKTLEKKTSNASTLHHLCIKVSPRPKDPSAIMHSNKRSSWICISQEREPFNKTSASLKNFTANRLEEEE